MYRNLPDGPMAPSQDASFSKSYHLDAFVREIRPRYPVSVLRPEKLTARAAEFIDLFPGQILYAVKCNPDRRVLAALITGGVNGFDCASINEIKLVRELKQDAAIYFMHPVKSRESIREAYFDYNVRCFVLDTADELAKIIDETQGAGDLTLFVRMAMPKQKVATDFSAKFGASPMIASQLLAQARGHAAKLGLAFHVGTHCTDTSAYRHAVSVAAGVIATSGAPVDALDIGGGFPADLDLMNPPPPLSSYISEVRRALDDANLSSIELLCEPGRGMVACGGALVVRVEGRKGDLLYLNDGTYGGMFEAGPSCDLPYPSRLIRAEGYVPSAVLAPFRLAGPTCDSVDMMKGPFMLPDDVREGDWIALDQLGAYGEVSRTGFNGFREVIDVIETEDNIIVSQAAEAT